MRCTWIEPGSIMAGDIPISAEDINLLHEHGIRSIISLVERPLTDFQEISDMVLSSYDIYYFHLPIRDQYPPTQQQVHQILNLIDTMILKVRPIFIHCHAGIGRTGTILQLYYLAKYKSLELAKEKVKTVKPDCLLLSEAQVSFLKEFEKGVQQGLI